MNYKTYADLSIDILENVSKIPNVNLVIGIPRSGMIPAYIIGSNQNVPVLSLSEFLMGEKGYQGRRKLKELNFTDNSRILIIDDSIDSGFAMSKARNEVMELELKNKFFYAAVYASKIENPTIDFYLKLLEQPRFFQWNYKNHFIATNSCYDIDGVICIDPTDEENDDSINYLKFLENAKPLYIPSLKISCLITSRLEKYRSETMDWLKRNKVDYGELIMMNLDSAQERRALGNHGQFKGETYKIRNEELFIESDWEQAKIIFEISNKPVICATNDILINNYADIVYHENQLARNARSLSVLFSENSDLGLKYQTLFKDYEVLRLDYSKLITSFDKIQKNKWYQFDKYSRLKKLKFLLGLHFIK
ncbi:Uncharacterized protein, HAD superfamily [Flavobacteriaceae bacterium MAR_2010_188]|nr:Uncharacterized protein, HAD superfamily [Flavobacteriaceae bacterium MAR_2010_188]